MNDLDLKKKKTTFASKMWWLNVLHCTTVCTRASSDLWQCYGVTCVCVRALAQSAMFHTSARLPMGSLKVTSVRAGSNNILCCAPALKRTPPVVFQARKRAGRKGGSRGSSLWLQVVTLNPDLQPHPPSVWQYTLWQNTDVRTVLPTICPKWMKRVNS